MIPAERLIVALDSRDRERVVELARILAPHAGMFKLGAVPWSAAGPALVREVRALAPVFVDLKLHDIPSTVAEAVRELAGLGASLLTVHACGGPRMLAAACQAAHASGTPRPRVLAVTVLTSLEPRELHAIGVEASPAQQALRLARLALEAGADGLVASPEEVGSLRALVGPEPLLVVPGIRPAWAEAGDQRRTGSPAQALRDGASHLVVGRPIVGAPDPVAAARRLREEG